MTNEQIQALVNEYNQAEAQQGQRLNALFNAMQEATATHGGGHEVRFSNGSAWGSNDFKLHEKVLDKVRADFSVSIESWK